MSLRRVLCISLALMALEAPGHAASISVTLNSDRSACSNNIDAACGGSVGGDLFGSAHFRAGGTSETIAGSGSTSVTFVAVAAVAADDGGPDVGQSDDRRITLALDYTLNVYIDVDAAADAWSVDLLQNAQGLFAFRGDGAGTAVGDQDDGQASLSTLSVVVDGSHFDFTTFPSLVDQDCARICRVSTFFSGSRSDAGVLSGTGDAFFVATVRLELSALSNDGCTGASCSSSSGGEEAAVLFGTGGVIPEPVDDYATWGRPVNSGDGYRSTWTLNVTVPEPDAILLLALVAAVPSYRRRLALAGAKRPDRSPPSP